ncbi:MAG: pilus assembly PilX N-terminal domain-containing protein [Desulfotomaculum sp.]|nr:pilus assembly PilX N-terminal domain-containing protein [Desulfotomaculum sp.]
MFFNRRGQVLLLVMVILTVILLLGGTALSLVYNTSSRNALNREQIQVYYTAEAGVEMVLARLKENFCWEEWSSEFNDPVPFAGGSVKVKVKTILRSDEEVRVEITSEGYYKKRKKTLLVNAKLQKQAETGEVIITITSWKEKYGVF